MGPGGTSIFKVVTISLYIIVMLGLVLNVVKAGAVWMKTGDWHPAVESTLGQVLYWDNQIYEGVQWLKNEDAYNQLPPSFREEFRDYVTKQIMFYIILFVIVGYGLFKFGNWIAGQAAMNPMTDLIIILLIIFVIFPVAEVGYGKIMRDEWHMPYRGIAELVKPSTWDLMFGDLEVFIDPYPNQYQNNLTQNNTGTNINYINLNNNT